MSLGSLGCHVGHVVKIQTQLNFHEDGLQTARSLRRWACGFCASTVKGRFPAEWNQSWKKLQADNMWRRLMEKESHDSRILPSKFPALGMLYDVVIIMHLSHTIMERFVTRPLLVTSLGAGCASLVCTQAWDNRASDWTCLCVKVHHVNVHTWICFKKTVLHALNVTYQLGISAWTALHEFAMTYLSMRHWVDVFRVRIDFCSG